MRMSVFSRRCMLTAWVAGSFGCGSNMSASLDPYTAPVENGIIDGTESTAKDYPSTGVLLFTTERDDGSPIGSMLCSGTLIAPDVVLVAGHCNLSLFVDTAAPVQYYFSTSLDVTSFGAKGDLTLPPHTTKVAKMLPHPQFDLDRVGAGLRHTYDIALVYLEKPVTKIKPSPVIHADEAAAIKKGAEVAIVGYGRRHEDNRGRGDAGIKYHGLTKVQEVGKYEMQISPGSPQPHKCHGDSGGPTFMKLGKGKAARLAVVGVTSHAYDEADCMHGGVDTRVDPYLNWINKNMEEACSDGSRPACDSSFVTLP